jgi:ABC-type multidrug transport system ATPase subunit
LFTYPPDQSWRPEDDITLLGDAAHVAPLFTGKEADYAILDAFELADCLAADRFPDIPSARAEYEHGMLTRKPERRAKQRSGHLSGGQRQRALIAAAIAAHPRILIADEPTTALDATVQRQILLLLRSTAERGSANLLMTRDLGVVSEVADDVAVMKDGQIVETGRTEAVLRYPRHAYAPAAGRCSSRQATAPATVERPRSRGYRLDRVCAVAGA